jgi:hypothetical protein
VTLRIDFRGCGESGGERGRVIPMEEVADARHALSYMASRPEVDPHRIALAGSSLGAGVAIHAAAVDPRVAAVILENAVANGERTIRGMHSAESWQQFLDRMDAGLQARARGEAGAKIHRFDIFEMPKHLQVNLRSNNSLMEFSADTPAAFFMFRPEDVIAKVAPRPILILHSAGDKVCTAEEAFNLARFAKPPVELHLMDGANHFLFVDADPRIAIMLRTWLDRFFPVKPSSS